MKQSESGQNHPLIGRITKNQPNALGLAGHDLNAIWFQSFTILKDCNIAIFYDKRSSVWRPLQVKHNLF